MEQINGFTKERFEAYLAETLIPDLKEAGMEATAEDFETALGFLKLEGRKAFIAKGEERRRELASAILKGI